jgi:TrmH family RNA methyltransferase
MISSAQNQKIKLIRLLTGRTRERREAGAFLAEGVRLVEEALTSDWPFQFVLHMQELNDRGAELLKRLRERGIELDEIPDKLLASLSETETSQGILAVLSDQKRPRVHDVHFALLCDAIREPGNLGTLLRTAEAAGVDAAFLAPGTTDAFAPKVVRAGMGAHFRLPIYEISWAEMRTQVQTYGWNVYLADMGGRSYWETDFRPPLALIIGGEAEGASAEARALAAHAVSIPMRGRADSLNAAVAGSILMFEILRQRRSSTGTEK